MKRAIAAGLTAMLALFGFAPPSSLAQEAREKLELQAGIEKGRPFLRSADSNFQIELGGRFQVDFHGAESGAMTLTGLDLNDRFLVRRARLELEGKLFQWVGFKLESELTDGVSLKDGYLDLAFTPEFRFRAGQFKVPFSLEELTSSRFIDFVERSLVNELAPSRDVGVMLHGRLFRGVLGYSVGAFNGTGEDAADANDEKDLAARVVLAPFRTSDNPWLKGLQLGGNVTFGDQDDSRSPQGRTGARTSNRFRFFASQPTRGTRTRVGGDLAWVVGPASLTFEYDVQSDDRDRLGPGGRDLDAVQSRGWYVSGTVLLTGEDKILNGPVVPRRPFQPVAGKLGPGAWELGLRYAELDFTSDDPVDLVDGDLAAITGGGRTAENKAQALTLGLNWYLNERVRFMLNGTNYWYDNRLGTPFSCPTACAATNPANLRRGEDTSWEILSRLQVWF